MIQGASSELQECRRGSSFQKSQCQGCWCDCYVLSDRRAIKNRPEGRLENSAEAEVEVLSDWGSGEGEVACNKGSSGASSKQGEFGSSHCVVSSC